MYTSFNRFMIQLKSFRKMVENTEFEPNEQSGKLTFETIGSIVIDRLFLDYRINNQHEFSEEEKEFNSMVIAISDRIIEKNSIARKLYEIIYVVEEDEDIVLESESPSILNYLLNSLENNNTLSKFQQDDMLFQSLSISLCSALENLSSEVLKDFYFNHHRGELIDNKEISFKNMLDFDSIDSVRQYLIDKEIEGIFRKSFSDWMKNLDEVLKIYKIFDKAKNISGSICELYQRRNLYVHANGMVNKRYLEVVESKYRDQINIGDQLKITKEYLLQKITEVESMGWFILYTYVIKFKKEDHWFAKLNDKLVSELSSANPAIPLIFKKLIENADVTEQDKLYSKINYFLFYHVNDNLDEVIEDLKRFNVSVYSIEYKMAKAILLDDEEKHDLIKRFFDTIEDDGEFLYCFDWPLLYSVKKEEPTKSYFDNRIKEIFTVSQKSELTSVDFVDVDSNPKNDILDGNEEVS